MATVTQRIKAIKQPRGGYLPPKSFKVTEIDGKGEILSAEPENISAALVGIAVDYLTRALIGKEASDAFGVSWHGATLIGQEDHAESLIEIIENLIRFQGAEFNSPKPPRRKKARIIWDKIQENIMLKRPEKVKTLQTEAITAACQLAGYDVCYRAGPAYYKPVQDILPDNNTIKNIEIMVNRSLTFFKKYGPVVKDGFTFEGGYSKIVNKGDGDFITADTLWDFKVSKKEPTSAHTLQLLMYYIMGQHSLHEYLHGITSLGIFNPRLNKIYTRSVTEISKEIIEEVAKDVICY